MLLVLVLDRPAGRGQEDLFDRLCLETLQQLPGRREVQEFVRDIRAGHDATILLCTHDLAEAEALADRVGILDGGELLCLDTVPEVLRRYGAASLEEAFLAARGRELVDEDDDEREVFA